VKIKKDSMFYRFSIYGFLKNLRFFEPFIILIFRSYGLSFLQIGILYSIRDISATILEIPTGLAADAFGRRRAMISAFSFYLISFLMIYFLQDFAFLSLAMIMFAFGEAFRSGSHKALILEYLSIHKISHLKVAYYGLTRSASQLGSALNALIAAGLAFSVGNYRVMFVAAVIPYVLDLINLASYPPELDGEIPGLAIEDFLPRLRSTLGGFLSIFKDEKVLRAYVNSSGFTAFFKSTKDYLQPILVSLVFSTAILISFQQTQREALVIGFVYFCIYLLTSYASSQAYNISGRFRDLFQAVNITYLAGGILLVIAGLTYSLQFQVTAIICFILIFILNNLRRPINVGIISDQISSSFMASGLSAESQLTTILSAIIAPLIGFLADTLGVGLGLGLIGGLMLLLFFFFRVK
jgi:MFS family permease